MDGQRWEAEWALRESTVNGESRRNVLYMAESFYTIRNISVEKGDFSSSSHIPSLTDRRID